MWPPRPKAALWWNKRLQLQTRPARRATVTHRLAKSPSVQNLTLSVTHRGRAMRHMPGREQDGRAVYEQPYRHLNPKDRR